ncbi:2,4-dichlorophenol 6-monooxygenase [Aspergillus luchuensis]|uniref:2,4-dichlorophenol 6-monooxygenase n=1 Tax=Aspergillus kawachii TaxID=1069201 RepID=A0A146FZA8_ASPKA|nr:2,4-dichlorophenol 6-monooxygenase [Aspergillus luchuensis]
MAGAFGPYLELNHGDCRCCGYRLNLFTEETDVERMCSNPQHPRTRRPIYPLYYRPPLAGPSSRRPPINQAINGIANTAHGKDSQLRGYIASGAADKIASFLARSSSRDSHRIQGLSIFTHQGIPSETLDCLAPPTRQELQRISQWRPITLARRRPNQQLLLKAGEKSISG